MIENAAILSQTLIDFRGEEFTSKAMEDSVSIWWDTDNEGYVVDVRIIKGFKFMRDEETESFIKELKDFAVSHGIRFKYCASTEAIGEEKTKAYIRERMEKGEMKFSTIIVFPGVIKSDYIYYRNDMKKVEKEPLEYGIEYLKLFITENIPPDWKKE
jgi:hypothetical protein